MSIFGNVKGRGRWFVMKWKCQESVGGGNSKINTIMREYAQGRT